MGIAVKGDCTVYEETEEGQACCVLASLKGIASTPAIPSFFLFNVCALDNKFSFEHLRLHRQKTGDEQGHS